MAYHSLRCCPRSGLKRSQSKRTKVLCRFVLRRMVWATDWFTPCFDVAAIATPARLLGDEEAYIVVRVVRSFEASCT